ncbi:MAG: hypothetical protein ISEC1_P0741 [Thiomicrorhabdus sp.]|nr:MAG: hypothetical protein ISEC1_P0741 [Thiomicrorhabdus sp.]
MKVKRLFMLASVAWITLVSLSYYWNYTVAKKEQEKIALESARTFYEYITITQLWNARHAGIYAAVTETTQPNPYLKTPMRDIKINDQLTLTKIDPAFMTRQLAEITEERGGIRFKITSLNPVNPKNTPSDFEKELLESFEHGVTEKGIFITENKQEKYLYMAPLITTKACLRCHSLQGYSKGDIRGGVSITLPHIMNIPTLSLLIGHILIGLTGLMAIFYSTRQLNRAYKTIHRQAIIDDLTGIANRRSFSEKVITEFRRHNRDKQPLSIIMCDIDKFKAFNDSYGHIAGDHCLRKVAQCIQSTLKRPSDFCARYGGEEFIILLPNTGSDGAKEFAERLRFNIQNLNIPNENSLPTQLITISLGVVTSTNTCKDRAYERFINKADEALYYAKKQGRNQAQLYSEIPPK